MTEPSTDPYEITLTRYRVGYADAIGFARQFMAEMLGRQQKNGATGGLDVNILGARCEIAAWEFFGCGEWARLSTRIHDLADIDKFIDVKGISEPNHRLIVQKDDPEDLAYLLVSAERHPTYRMVGWRWGHEAKKKEFWDDPTRSGRGAFFVPQNRLRPVLTLIEEWEKRCRKPAGATIGEPT